MRVGVVFESTAAARRGGNGGEEHQARKVAAGVSARVPVCVPRPPRAKRDAGLGMGEQAACERDQKGPAIRRPQGNDPEGGIAAAKSVRARKERQRGLTDWNALVSRGSSGGRPKGTSGQPIPNRKAGPIVSRCNRRQQATSLGGAKHTGPGRGAGDAAARTGLRGQWEHDAPLRAGDRVGRGACPRCDRTVAKMFRMSKGCACTEGRQAGPGSSPGSRPGCLPGHFAITSSNHETEAGKPGTQAGGVSPGFFFSGWFFSFTAVFVLQVDRGSFTFVSPPLYTVL
jgi:hypothetical protein